MVLNAARVPTIESTLKSRARRVSSVGLCKAGGQIGGCRKGGGQHYPTAPAGTGRTELMKHLGFLGLSHKRHVVYENRRPCSSDELNR